MALAGARVVVGVSGGIACYKAVELVRQLMTAGAVVDEVGLSEGSWFVLPWFVGSWRLGPSSPSSRPTGARTATTAATAPAAMTRRVRWIRRLGLQRARVAHRPQAFLRRSVVGAPSAEAVWGEA